MDNFYSSITPNIFSDATDINSPLVSTHYHSTYEMYYLLKGMRIYFTNKNSYPLKQDYITLTKPKVLHGTKGTPVARILLNFDESFLKKYFTADFTKNLLRCFSTDMIPAETVHLYPQIKTLFFQTHEMIENKDFDAVAINLASLLHTINIALKSQKQEDALREKRNIEYIWQYIEENLESIENIEQIAHHFHFSKYYFCHFFKKQTGLPVIEYVCYLRIQRAQEMLRNTNKSIEEIAMSIGFKDRSYFCLTFKKKVGIPPSKYRRTYKNNDGEINDVLYDSDLPTVHFK